MSEIETTFDTDYCFSITAELEPRVVGEVPGGIRIDIGYTRGKVLLRQKSLLSKYFGHKPDKKGKYEELKIGEISSGQDWILVGAVGTKAFADFDGRLTLRITKPPASEDAAKATGSEAETSKEIAKLEDNKKERKDVLGGHSKGRVDLDVDYAKWLRGDVKSPMPVLLPFALDVSTSDSQDIWVEPGPYNTKGKDTDLTKLGRSVLLGRGEVTCKKERYSPPRSVDLNFFKWTGK